MQSERAMVLECFGMFRNETLKWIECKVEKQLNLVWLNMIG